jgi:hypothetical protein
MKLTRGKIEQLYNKKNQTFKNNKYKNHPHIKTSIKNKQRLNLSKKTLKQRR